MRLFQSSLFFTSLILGSSSGFARTHAGTVVPAPPPAHLPPLAEQIFRGKLSMRPKLGDIECLDSAEIYDPAAHTWTMRAPMSVGRCYPASVTLGDRALVIGGVTPQSVVLASSEIYDAGTDTWAPIASMSRPRYGATALKLPDGRVMVVGGDADADENHPATAEIYDATTNVWTSTLPLATVRGLPRLMVLTDGRVLAVSGGLNVAGEVRPEIYDFSTNAWTEMAAMPNPRVDSQAILLQSGLVWVAGGNLIYNGAMNLFSSPRVDYFDPVANVWTEGVPMFHARCQFSAFEMDPGHYSQEWIISSGGADQLSFSKHLPLGLDASEWSAVSADFPNIEKITPLGELRTWPMTANLPNDEHLIIGGYTSDIDVGLISKTVDRLKTPGREGVFEWVHDSELNEWRLQPAIVVLPSGQIVAAGGQGGQVF